MQGERIAAAHLAERGFQVLERNFRTRYGELDLVLAGEGCIVFCEVKTRVGAGRSGPAGALDATRATRGPAETPFAAQSSPQPRTAPTLPRRVRRLCHCVACACYARPTWFASTH